MSNLSSTLIRSQSVDSENQTVIDAAAVSAERERLIKMMKSLYQADQQAKFLNLQQEVDSLLQQLQSIKLQRVGTLAEDSPADLDFSS